MFEVIIENRENKKRFECLCHTYNWTTQYIELTIERKTVLFGVFIINIETIKFLIDMFLVIEIKNFPDDNTYIYRKE